MLYNLPSASQPTTSSSEGCSVCGDKVNGSRYGAPACLGCIVFFRRAINNNSKFKCASNGQCAIDHQSRCACRYCRLQKCLKVGMNPDSIQRRDMMGPRKKREEEIEESPEVEIIDVSPSPRSLLLSLNGAHADPLLLGLLKIQERQHSSARYWFPTGGPERYDPYFVKGIRNLDTLLCGNSGGTNPLAPSTSSIASPSTSSPYSTASANSLEDLCNIFTRDPLRSAEKNTAHRSLRRARKADINVMFHLAIVDSVEWGSQFPVFRDLPSKYKRQLLKEYSIGFMLVDQGFNTSRQKDESLWILQHDKVFMCVDYNFMLPEEDKNLPMAETKAKLHPDFVLQCITCLGNPMREMQIEHFECVVLKTLLLFECFNVFPEERKPEIALIRDRCLQSLAVYEAEKHPEEGIERIGTILLMIGNIRNCILATCRQLHICDVFSLMQFEPLVADVLLNKEELSAPPSPSPELCHSNSVSPQL